MADQHNEFYYHYSGDWLAEGQKVFPPLNNQTPPSLAIPEEKLLKLSQSLKEKPEKAKSEVPKFLKLLGKDKASKFGWTSDSMSNAVQMVKLQEQAVRVSQTYEGKELVKHLNLMYEDGLISAADFCSELTKAMQSSKDKPYKFNKNYDCTPQTYSKEDLFQKLKEAEKS